MGYKDIIWIKQMIANGVISQEIAEKYIPELKESEDERIRKAITEFFKNFSKNGTWKAIPDVTKWIAWLEKQGGEQNLTLPKWKYKKDNTPLLRDSIILNKYGCVAKSPSGALISDVWVLDYDELAKLPKEELEKQGEQKHADKVEPKFHEGEWVTEGTSLFVSLDRSRWRFVVLLPL